MTKKRISIVIVDDNAMMRAILRSMLRAKEYEVIGEAGNGLDAVNAAVRLKPDVVCLDVIMPEKDGLDALCEIKAAQPQIEVVMITSNADPATVQESIRSGASGFIIKPFNAASVLNTLEKVAERIRQRQS